MLYIQCRYAECRYAECRYADFRRADLFAYNEPNFFKLSITVVGKKDSTTIAYNKDIWSHWQLDIWSTLAHYFQ